MKPAAEAAAAPSIAIVGAGPAGLMAAQACADQGARVTVFDAMPSVGRKFLLAGKGGLNLTHSEPADTFERRYGDRRAHLQPMLDAFGPAQLRAWVHGLGVETFVGSSGRVFPREMKAAPMLRAWLRRLREAGVAFHSRCRWTGALVAGGPAAAGPVRLTLARSPAADAAPGTPIAVEVEADAVVLALGGGSWPRLGSDGAWVPWLTARGVAVAPLAPANCGFDCGWSDHFSSRFAGSPVKSVAMALHPPPSGPDPHTDGPATATMLRGEFVVTATGVEGSLVYTLSAPARDRLAVGGSASLYVDLLPDRPLDWIRQRLEQPRGTLSLSNHLRRKLGLEGVKAALLRECLGEHLGSLGPQALASAIKGLPVRLLAPRPLAEAISTAGGVAFESLDHRLMCRALPGVFCAGEMLDWEAPTGGYLLTACFASGRAAGLGAVQWLRSIATSSAGAGGRDERHDGAANSVA